MIYWSLFHISVVIVLTVVTQIGGLAYVATWALVKSWLKVRRSKVLFRALLFFGIYAGLCSGAYFTASHFGRVALPCFKGDPSQISVQSPLYCLLNRHYVSPDLRDSGNALAGYMHASYPGSQTLALDANFPFFNGFPLLPHLSHDDGRKLDIAFYYRNDKNEYVPGETKSPVGYWGFEQPIEGNSQQCSNNKQNWNLRWDMDWFQFLNNRHYQLDGERTSAALRWLATQGQSYGVSKIFVEPYLAKQLGVSNEIIRFQGCGAARHDDHIHIQIR